MDVGISVGVRWVARSVVLAILGLGATVAGCGSDNDPVKSGNETAKQAVTYYDDVLPILEQRCLHCHQAGGIAPLQFDDYASAKISAMSMRDATAARVMPPWAATANGSCGEFANAQALTDDQIATIGAWAESGAPEGGRRRVELPKLPSLTNGKVYSTPNFAPVIQGGQLAEFDDYRCFLLDSDVTEPQFITGYEVLPGNPSIVHHVLGFLVDPESPSSDGSTTNAARMAALDEASPDREGWPCFGMAGEGVTVAAAPVTWAPGQGVVTYPGDSGVPVTPNHKLVIQVHYNLADSAQHGKTDQTQVKLRLASTVDNVGIFVLWDPFLGSLSDSNGPASLEAGLESTKYSWKATVDDMGLGAIPQLSLYGIVPHMHQRGRKYHATVGDPSDASSCAMDIQRWDFHWQWQYQYASARPVEGSTPIEVTCDFDTSAEDSPVLPGWGTRNEMCLAVLYFTTPLASTTTP